MGRKYKKKPTYSAIEYDADNHLYKKTYTKDAWYTIKGMRVCLGLFKTPGRHVQHIDSILQKLSIPTAEIVTADDYEVVTREINAVTLLQYRKEHGPDAFREELLDIFVTTLHAGLVHRDPRMLNFLCDGKQLYAIDIESFFDTPCKFLPKPKLLYFIWVNTNRDDDFCRRIAQAWPKRTGFYRGMDIIYDVRSFFLRLFHKGNKEEQAFIQRVVR